MSSMATPRHETRDEQLDHVARCLSNLQLQTTNAILRDEKEISRLNATLKNLDNFMAKLGAAKREGCEQSSKSSSTSSRGSESSSNGSGRTTSPEEQSGVTESVDGHESDMAVQGSVSSPTLSSPLLSSSPEIENLRRAREANGATSDHHATRTEQKRRQTREQELRVRDLLSKVRSKLYSRRSGISESEEKRQQEHPVEK